MKVQRTFSLSTGLVQRMDKIPSGKRSEFVESALEQALGGEKGVALKEPSASSSPSPAASLSTPLPKVAARRR